ncbi:WD repeat-containing protein 91-like isoform X2 [Liolophura sinensis]
MNSVRKLEVGLFKYYLVNASQNNRTDKVREFFEVMTPELQNQSEFKEWFTLPFIRTPEENSSFAIYFTRQWQDTFFLSFHNFISVMLQAMPAPVLLTFEQDQKKMRALREENESLKAQIRNHPDFQTKSRSQTVTNPMELMDDFFSISGDVAEQETQSKARSEKKFFQFPSSPLMRKSTNSKPAVNSDGNRSGQGLGSDSRAESEKEDVQPTSGRIRSTLQGQGQRSGQVLPPTSDYPQGQVTRNTPVTTPELRHRKAEENGKQKREKKMEEFDRQRKELFGAPKPDIRKPKDKRNSVSDTPVSQNRPDAPGESSSTNTEPSPSSLTETRDRGMGQDHTTECPFLLLSQEEYSEHHSTISNCSFSITGQYIVSSDVDGVVKVWTWSPQPVTRATIMSKSSFLSLSWTSKTDRLLLLGNKSGNVKLFDVKDIKTICDVSMDPAYPRVISLCCNPAGSQFVCSASADKSKSSSAGEVSSGRVGRLSVWELKSMKMNGTLPIGPSPSSVNCTCYNHNGQLLLTGAEDGSIRLFDMRQLSCLAQWSAHEGEVLSVQFSSDETSCFSMGGDGKFMQWSINNQGRRLADLAVHPGACPVLPSALPNSSSELPRGKLFSFDSEGKYVLTCGRLGGTIYQHTNNMYGLAKIMELKGHRSGVTTVDWSPSVDTRVCLTGAMDGKVKVSTLLSR